MIALAAVLLALAGGIAAAIGMTFLIPALSDERDLQSLSKRPVIGSVSVFRDVPARRSARWQLVRFGGAAGTVLTAGVAWLGWIAVGGTI